MSGESKFEPSGRYRRFLWDFNVEVVDETALKAFTMHGLHGPGFDENGDLGMHMSSDNDRIGYQLALLFHAAVQQVEDDFGVKLVRSGGFPMAMSVEEDGNYYQALTIGRRPVDGDDGEPRGPWPTAE